MDLLRIFLYFLLLITTVMAFGVIIAFIDGSMWSQGRKLLRSIWGVVVILSPVTVFYSLFVDENGLVWIGVSVVLFFSTSLLLVYAEARDAGITWSDIWSFVREVKKRVVSADKLVRLPDQVALPTDEHLRAQKLASKLGLQQEPKSPEGSLSRDLRTLGLITIVPFLLFSAIYVGFKYASLAHLPAEVQPFLTTYFGFPMALAGESLIYRAMAKNARFSSVVALSKASYVTAQVIFVCAIFAFMPSFAAQFSVFDGVSSDATFFVGGFALVSVFVSRTLLKPHVTESMSQAISRDIRPPVIYFRSFSRESIAKALLEQAKQGFRGFSMLGRIAVTITRFALSKFKEEDLFESEMDRIFNDAFERRGVFGRLTYRNVLQSFASGRGGFFDEQLVIANIFGQIGPYVAISRPGETSTWSDVGAAKQAFPDDKWKEAARHLIVDSAIIVFEAGNSTNLIWEVEQIVRLASPLKVLLLLPKSEHEYADFRNRTQTIFPKPLPTQRASSQFLYFDRSWSPRVLQYPVDYFESQMSQASCVPMFLPFLEQNGFTLAAPSETPLKIAKDETCYSLHRERRDDDASIVDLISRVELPSVSPDQLAKALVERGLEKWRNGDSENGIADYSAAIEMPNAPPDQVSRALANRGVARGELGDSDGEIADYTAAIELPNAPPDHVSRALVNRGDAKGRQRDRNGEIADYTAAIELPNAPSDQVSRALVKRGVARGELGDSDGEIADYTTAIEMPNAPPDQVSRALANRGGARGELGESDGEIADYTAAIELPNAPPNHVSRALVNRGNAKGRQRDRNGEIADYTAAIELPNAPPVYVSRALVDRGAAKGRQGDRIGEIADYTFAIELPNAPPYHVSRALVNRGAAKGRKGDSDGEIADYTAAIGLPNAPPDQVVRLFLKRGAAKGRKGDSDGEIADYTAVIELPDAPPDQVARALVKRASRRRWQGDAAGAFGDYTTAVDLRGAPDDVTEEAKRGLNTLSRVLWPGTSVVELQHNESISEYVSPSSRKEET